MERSIYGFIFRYSMRQQVLLVVLTAVSFPFLYYSLDLPKRIVNEALGGKGKVKFPVDVWGIDFSQLEYLWTLSALFLVLVCINGGFKYWINVLKGRLGERMLRRLRYELYARILRFPMSHFRRVSQGEIIPMITSEVEPLGGFIGDAVALPAFQGGTLLTIVGFMFVQDWVLGLAAVALYPAQAFFIPKMQRKVNQLGKQRVRAVRTLSEKIGESISGVQEIRANHNARLALARFADQLRSIYDIRYEIYQRKFFIKFLNNFIGQLTPFFFYAIGGYLVVEGRLSLGALVAVLAAYKDLSAPWRELLQFYQQKEDSRIKYEQVIEQFDPAGIMDETLQLAEPDGPLPEPSLRTSNLGLVDDDGQPVLEGVSVRIEPGQKVALLGPTGGGKEVLAQAFARLHPANTGQVLLGDRDVGALPESVTGRQIGYVGPTPYVFSSSIRENLLLGAMHRPLAPPAPDPDRDGPRADALRSAEESGNSLDQLEADWVDYPAIGIADGEALPATLVALLQTVELSEDCYQLGLRGTVDPARRPEVAERVLAARRRLRERLEQDPSLTELVEPLAADRYNSNATVAENLMFGTPVGDVFTMEALADHPYVHQVLARVGLAEDFVVMGHQMAETMVELFADLPADHEFFAQFSFISPDDLPEFQALIGRVERVGLDNLAAEDRNRLLSLPFRMIPARHRLGLLDETRQARILEARAAFAEGLPDDLRGAVAFFDAEAYNAAASLQDNILFGKVAYGHADAAARVGAAVAEVLETLELRSTVVEIGLDFQVGIAGARLTAPQRQKLALARVLLRRPQVLVLNDAISALDGAAQARLIDSVLGGRSGGTIVWALPRAELARPFDRVMMLRDGRLTADGKPADLDREGTAFHAAAAGG